MKHRQEIIESLDKADFRAIAGEIVKNAYPMLDQANRLCGQMDGVLVYDEEDGELKVVAEGPSTWTPSYTYLFRLEGNEDYDAMSGNERDELEDNIWEGLIDMYDRVKNEEDDD